MPANSEALFDKATEAIELQNYDYAIELLMHVVEAEPKNVKARQVLWLAERRKFAAQPASGKNTWFKTLGPWMASAVHALSGKPAKIIMDCEKYLMINPENVTIRNKLGQAAYETGDMDLALAAYECVREVEPTNPTALRQLGRLYEEKFNATHSRQDLTLAMQRFEELLKYRPMDHEARSSAQRLAAERAIDDGGWHEAESARTDLVRDADKQQELMDKDRLVKTEDDVDRELKRLEDAIRAEPTRPPLYVRQGDLMLQKKRFKSAEESFRKAQELEPQNTFTRARMGEVKIQFMKARLEPIEEKLDADPDNAELKKQADEIRGQLQEYMIAEYRQRVQDQPTNMEVHHQLGQLLMKAGDFDGAMGMFQKSVTDPRYRMAANHMLGKCLVEKQMYDRAINIFKRAIEGVVVMNHLVKAVYYDLGETYEKMGNFSEAEHAFGKIYDADVGYRDISEKMEAVYRKAREQKEKKEKKEGTEGK